MKVQTKSLSQRGTYLAVASLFCGLFYNSGPAWLSTFFQLVFAGIGILLAIIFFGILPCVFWVSLAVLLVSSFIEDWKKGPLP